MTDIGEIKRGRSCNHVGFSAMERQWPMRE